jgi:serine protease Do
MLILPSNMKAKLIFCLPLLFLWVIIPGPVSLAAEKNRTSAKATPEKSTTQSVEALTERARQSVVVISHFGRDGKEDGIGAGVIISSNGLIATCLHVIGEARPIKVQLQDGQKFDVIEVHAWDRKMDLAIIKVQADNLVPLPLGDSDALKQGASVLAMGNPLGLKHSVVQGLVSARRDFDGMEMIQLAIPIEPGNSGGPLLDMEGRVHGLLTLKSAITANLGFATPVNALKNLLKKPNTVPMTRWLTIGTLNPRDWATIFGARWGQKAGRITVETPGSGFGGRSLCLSTKKVPEIPYEIAVTVKLDDESGAAGLVFGADGSDKHYGFYPSGGQLRLTRFDGPSVFSWSILSQKSSPAYRPGDWNTLKVRVEKDKVLCFVNDVLSVEAQEDNFAGAQVGLAKFRETRAEFKNFQLAKRVEPAAKPPSDDLKKEIAAELDQFASKPASDVVKVLQKNPEASATAAAERAIKLENEAAQMRKLAATVRQQAVQNDMIKVLQGAEDKIDLFHAALLVAKLDNPELDVAAYRQAIDEMAEELKSKLTQKADGQGRLKALVDYLFSENGFHGSRSDYYNRANSYINQVMDDREGLPITLSVLFIELARRIDLPGVTGLPLPAHFMVQYSSKGAEAQLIDVFDGGKMITRTEAEEIAFENTGEPLRDEQLKSATKKEIIVRMLHNLASVAERSETGIDAQRYMDLILAIAPDSAQDRLHRARLRLQARDIPGAKQDLRWLLDHEPRGIDMDRVAELYQTL